MEVTNITKLSTIGERIRFSRKANMLTISQVSSETGMSVGNLSDLENNKSMPSANALINLSKLLNVSNDWLLLGDDCIKFTSVEYYQNKEKPLLIKDSHKAKALTSLPDDEKELLESYRLLTEDRKRDLIGFIRVLKVEAQK